MKFWCLYHSLATLPVYVIRSTFKIHINELHILALINVFISLILHLYVHRYSYVCTYVVCS